jgi:NACalpha-BTF3-like transcription factor
MPIVNTEVAAGDPTIQASGQRRGKIIFTFDDGRIVERNVRAPDANAWANLLIDLVDEVEKRQQENDAEELSQEDVEIVAHKQANIKQVALAFLRRAYSTGHPLTAYQKFSRFNDYRLAQGWNLNQVVAGLAEVGLTDEEWTDMRDRYQYLSNASRVTAMQAYQSVLDGDTWGAEYRD